MKYKLINWIEYKIVVKNKIFTRELLNTNLNKFWSEIVENKINENQHIWLLFRMQWANSQIVTIGKLVKLNIEDKDYLLNFLIDEMEDKSEYYKTTNMIAMIFSYSIKKGRAKDKVVLESSNLQYQDYQHHKLPVTMNPLEYGKLIDQTDNSYIIQVNETNIVKIVQEENLNRVKFFRKGELRYEFIDEKVNENTFIRKLENKQFTFIDKELSLYTVGKSVKFIAPLTSLQKLTNKIITMDIETFIKDGNHTAYTISYFDGTNSSSYYLTDYKDSEDMIRKCINEIMIRKYDNYKVYIHNLSNFDANFLLKILINLGEVKPIIHDNKIISISFKMNGYQVIFKDSQQLLIRSLRSLAKSFGVETQKSIFPYTFVNERKLDYKGHVPHFKYFDKIDKVEYDNYCRIFENKLWSLKDETIKYCEIDCISLYQVIIEFNNLIFSKFNISVHKYPTLSSLAFAIFRTHFLKKDTISQLSGQVAKDIRESYTGGAVDMYIPENPDGSKIYCYDVNSLYPFTMKDKLTPSGKPIFFKGDIWKTDPDAFGFFYCKIIAPDNLVHPIIQTHVKTTDGTRTIAPLGTWFDILFSEEIQNAEKYGYKFEILWGYKFIPAKIFNNYVDNLYKLRVTYSTSNPLNYIAKLLLNSLYGRFGMLDAFPDITILDSKISYLDFENKFSDDILDIIELGNKVLIKHRSEDKDLRTLLYGNVETHNVNIAIASAITAYARIHMSQFKNNPDFTLYYSDTDSAYFDRPLPDHMVNDKVLGKMKLENTVKKAIFLAPKVYFLETIDGKVIYKVKGLSHDIELTLKDFESLLIKESWIQKVQTKWRKNLSLGHISVLDELYTLKVTSNKRKLIYKNSKLIGTEPYIINENKEIINM